MGPSVVTRLRMDVRPKQRSARRKHKPNKPEIITDLPPELLLHVFSFLDVRTLGRLAQVSRRLRQLAHDDCLWSRTLRFPPQIICPASLSSIQTPRTFDVARISHNWLTGTFEGRRVVSFQRKEIPRLRLAEARLDIDQKQKGQPYIFSSRGNVIETRRHGKDTRVELVFRGLTTDVTDFVVHQNQLIGVSRDGSLAAWPLNDEEKTFTRDERYGGGKWKGKKKTVTVPTRYPSTFVDQAHEGDIHAIVGGDNFCVTGSRDGFVKVWNFDDEVPTRRECVDQGGGGGINLSTAIPVDNRVWSLGLSSDNTKLAVGTAGMDGVPALLLWDIASGHNLQALGDVDNAKNGAGILHLHFETPQMLVAAGYDTCLRVWDLRTNSCAIELEDPHDNAVYCACSDATSPLVVTGTARHAIVNVWDRRRTDAPLRMIYSNLGETRVTESSPVYSLAMDWDRIYAAHDTGISFLDFGKYRAVNEDVRGSYSYSHRDGAG